MYCTIREGEREREIQRGGGVGHEGSTVARGEFFGQPKLLVKSNVCL